MDTAGLVAGAAGIALTTPSAGFCEKKFLIDRAIAGVKEALAKIF